MYVHIYVCFKVNGREDHCASPEENNIQMNGESKIPSSVAFMRGSGRLSILGNNAETYRWVEAADRQLIKVNFFFFFSRTIHINVEMFVVKYCPYTIILAY